MRDEPDPPVSTLAPLEPLAALGDQVLPALRARLTASGYTQEIVFQAEAVAPAQLDSVRLPLVQWWLARRPGPEWMLARLFAYADAVPAREVRAALGEPLAAELQVAGALTPTDGDALRTPFRLTPLEGLFILSDPPEGGGDAVMGPGITTLGLVRLLPARPGTSLDLGCGAGTVALVAAARGAGRAVGIDINARAIALAQINARLNDSRAEFRVGDLLQPVAGERFDLVFSQPPYVVQPAGVAATTYLHGGPTGDEMALRFAAAIPPALAPGGRAFLLFDSARGGRPALHDRLQAALGDAAVDLLVFAAPGPSPDLQAVAYASLESRDLGPRYRAAVRRYRQHLEATGATSFQRALVMLADSPLPASRYSVQLPVSGLGAVAADGLERFLAGLALARAPAAEVLAAVVRLAPGARLVEERAGEDLAGEPKRWLRFDKGGLPPDGEVSDAGLVLFGALQTAPRVAAAVDAFAAACDAQPPAVQDQVLAFVRESLARGVLAPA
jgi:SAM-dependent methyltransferase